MSNIKFNFNRLKNIYSDAWERNDPTIAFEIRIGVGCFVFMMFLSKEEADKNDKLFIYYRNINTLSQLKLYGHHLGGDFIAYITPKEEELIRKELQLRGGGNPFDCTKFLSELNNSIPQFLPPSTKSETLQRTWPNIKSEMKSLVDDADKTILIGLKPLPKGHKPRDQTLRKLYIHANGVTDDITDFLQALKERNFTLAWTNDPTRTAKSFAQLLAEFASK
ncbi:hypothetical protein [Raoultella terrigena]|uniref:hypothetical protein n=1 Tax=Raoultella terrigena TaxID=577 RepID=UPI0005F81440|nr:hypothetical protein [Raoultella terrigena]